MLFRNKVLSAQTSHIYLSILFWLSILLGIFFYDDLLLYLLHFIFPFSSNFAVTQRIAYILSWLMIGTVVINYFLSFSEFKELSHEKRALLFRSAFLNPKIRPEDRLLLETVQDFCRIHGIPEPTTLINRDERAINAHLFCGKDQKLMLFISAGSLMYLNQNELKSLIAHAYSRIHLRYFGDDLKLSAMISGYYSVYSWMSRNPLSTRPAPDTLFNLNTFTTVERMGFRGMPNFIGLLTIILGFIGNLFYLFGKIIQLFISKKQEKEMDLMALKLSQSDDWLNVLRKALVLAEWGITPNLYGTEWIHLMSIHCFSPFTSIQNHLRKRIKNLGGIISSDEWEQLEKELIIFTPKNH